MLRGFGKRLFTGVSVVDKVAGCRGGDTARTNRLCGISIPPELDARLTSIRRLGDKCSRWRAASTWALFLGCSSGRYDVIAVAPFHFGARRAGGGSRSVEMHERDPLTATNLCLSLSLR